MKIIAANPDLRMNFSVVTPPSVEPLTITEAKAHLRVTDSNDDTYITTLIAVARERIDGPEGYLGRALLTQTWDCFIDGNFPPESSAIEMQLAPLQSVTYIKYAHPDTGTMTTVSSSVYTVDTAAKPSRIFPAYNQYWPDVRCIPSAIQVRGIFGYGDAATAVPTPIKQALLLMIGHMYENREETTSIRLDILPAGVEALLAPYRIRRF